jgi:hypothetical protein
VAGPQKTLREKRGWARQNERRRKRYATDPIYRENERRRKRQYPSKRREPKGQTKRPRSTLPATVQRRENRLKQMQRERGL